MKNGQVAKEHLDQYFTPKDSAEAYALEVVKRYGTDAKYIEPTAGSGVFVDALIVAGVPKENILAFDLDPQDGVHNIVKRNALSLTKEEVEGANCIGNLPFGKGGSMAMKIMNHLAEMGANSLSFLNPICIGNKHFTLKTLDKSLVKVESFEFEEGKHFTYPNDPDKDLTKPNPVRCEFQVWEKGCRKDPDLNAREHESFEIIQIGVEKGVHENGRSKELTLWERGILDVDFTIISHGKLAGTVKDFEPRKDKASVKLFVRVKDGFDLKEVRKFLENANLKELTKWSTIAHNPSIAPSEIIAHLGA